MRYKNENNDLRIYAVAGTQTVMLAFHLTKTKSKGKFMGFHITRKGSDGVIVLKGHKLFQSLVDDSTITDPKIKYVSLIQSFLWHDYLADPARTYTYTVKAMYGTARNFIPKYESSIKVRTETLVKGKHSVFFNYGVTGSQAYASNKEFGNQPLDNLAIPIRKKALDYLSRDLYHEGLIAFIEQAKSSRHSLYCAFYEVEYEGVLDKLKEVKAAAKNLEIIYSAQSGQNQDLKDPSKDKGNISSLKEAGLFDNISHRRTKASQPHNKFMILCKDDKPIQVWTGSTNLTMSGIFGQSNTGHWIKNVALARKYKKYWDLLKTNPSLKIISALSDEIQETTDLNKLKSGTYVFFSPRNLPVPSGTVPPHLLSYVDLIDKAKELVCMIFPFNYDKVFKEVYDKDRSYLRYLIFEKVAQAKKAKSGSFFDRDLNVTGGAILEEEVKNFIGEVTPKKTVKGGVLFVHNKFFLVDPLGENPCVVSGSANFSNASIKSNDENTLFIKGDTRVADIYLTEFSRLFTHFWPRYISKITKNKKKGFSAGLDENYTWFNDYYKSDDYRHKRGKMFIKMVAAKQA